MAQQLHSGLREQLLRAVFGVRINFMIAVATVNAERRGQAANFFNALFQRITCAGDEVSGDDGEIGAEVVGHIDGAANLRTRHVTAHVNVAELRDGHAIERSGQIGNRDFDAVDLIVEAFGGEAVHCAKKRHGTSGGGGGLEEIAAAGISGLVDQAGGFLQA